MTTEIALRLNDDEKTALYECEQTIKRGLTTFLDVGVALLAIREQRLYRESHSSFEAYCSERWAMPWQRAYQMIDAAQVSTMVEGVGNERQARELAPLRNDPDAMREVWQEANEATGGKPTAKAIKTARHKRAEPDDLPPPNTDTDPEYAAEAAQIAAESEGSGLEKSPWTARAMKAVELANAKAYAVGKPTAKDIQSLLTAPDAVKVIREIERLQAWLQRWIDGFDESQPS